MIFLSKFTVDAGWMDIGRRTCGHVYRGQCFGWAAALVYYSFLALFPALVFVVSVAGFLPIQRLIDRVVDLVGQFAPGDVVAIAPAGRFDDLPFGAATPIQCRAPGISRA